MSDANNSERAEVDGLVAIGAAHGHRVTVTALGPAWVAECGCGTEPIRRASKHQANQAGLAHLRGLHLPSPFVVHQGADEQSLTEFMVTTYADGLVTIATRAAGETSWSPQHALTERTEVGADGLEVVR